MDEAEPVALKPRSAKRCLCEPVSRQLRSFAPCAAREHGREKKSRQDPNDRAENGDTIHDRQAATSPEIAKISHGCDPKNGTKILVHWKTSQ